MAVANSRDRTEVSEKRNNKQNRAELNRKKTNQMKKYIVLAIAMTGFAISGFAQASAPLTISGSVAQSTTISIAAQPGYNALDLVNGATAKLVGIATEKSNDKQGYTVTVSSLNAGATSQAFLKGAIVGNTDVVNYSIQYNGGGVTLANGSATVTIASGRTPGSGVAKNLAVTFAGAWLTADTYSDTLTLTITGN